MNSFRKNVIKIVDKWGIFKSIYPLKNRGVHLINFTPRALAMTNGLIFLVKNCKIPINIFAFPFILIFSQL